MMCSICSSSSSMDCILPPERAQSYTDGPRLRPSLSSRLLSRPAAIRRHRSYRGALRGGSRNSEATDQGQWGEHSDHRLLRVPSDGSVALTVCGDEDLVSRSGIPGDSAEGGTASPGSTGSVHSGRRTNAAGAGSE